MFFVSPMVVPIVVRRLDCFFLFFQRASAGQACPPLMLGHTLVATPLVIVLVRAACGRPMHH